MPAMPVPMTAMFFGIAKLPCIVRPLAGSPGHARLSLTHRTPRLRLAGGVRSPGMAAIGGPANDPNVHAGRTRGHACRERNTLAQIFVGPSRTDPARSRHAA